MKVVSKYIPWPLALFISLGVFIPSLFFKFTGAAESRHIFVTVGEFLGIGIFEPYGRFLIGTAELIASVLLLIPRFQIYGAVITIGVLSGAIFFHLFTPLGVVVRWTENGMAQQDATLFMLAVASVIAALAIIWFRRQELSRLLESK
ncbi:MAG: DoxX family protein [Desulfobacteraceae bacterium]